MNAIFPSSRPNISVRVLPKVPATMVGVGGIGISKADGIWTITPAWDDLLLIQPGVLLDPSTKEIWVHDPVTDVYNRMTLQGLGQALFWGTSTTPLNISVASKTFTTQSGKGWPPGSFIQAISQAVPADYMIGQVTSYVGTTLTVNMLNVGGAGNSHADWLIITSTLPGSGPPGATGASAGLNFNWSTSVGGVDPLSGNIAVNSAVPGTVTLLSVNHAGRAAVDYANEIATWDDGTSQNKARVRIYATADPTAFFIGTLRATEANFGTWSQFQIVFNTGSLSFTNGQSVQVEILRVGDAGADGSQAGAKYNFNTSVANTDPGNGFAAYNNATPSLANTIRISETTASGNVISAIIQSWDDSTTLLNRGTLSILSTTDPTHFVQFFINGAITDNGTWDSIPVSWIQGGGGFAASEVIQVLFSRTGDKGLDGSGTIAGGNNHAVAISSGPNSIGSSVALTAGQILVGVSGGADPAARLVNGDASMDLNGLLTIGNDAVTYAKMQPVSVADRVLGSTTVPGDVVEIPFTAAARALSALATLASHYDAITIHGPDVPSAGTINLDAATTGNLIDVTGTITITAITLSDGRNRTVRFTGALTLTNGASLVLPGGANITTGVGDYAVFRGYAAGVVRCVAYTRALGRPLNTNYSDTIAVGYLLNPLALGTIPGAFTPNPALGNYQFGNHDGTAVTISAPANDCAMDILITNTGSPSGTLVFSGFANSAASSGDTPLTTNGFRYLVSIRRIGTISSYFVKAYQ